MVSSSFPSITKAESFFPHDNPIKIIDEKVSVSTSTTTEVNLVPTSDIQERLEDSAPLKKTSDGRIKSTNVPANLWLTAKDILHNLESSLLLSEQNKEMTNSPIVIIPVEDEYDAPSIDYEALKPIASKSPITFVNMNGRPNAPQTRPVKPDKPPSSYFVENFWTPERKNVSLVRRKFSTPKPVGADEVITFRNNFPMDSSTVGLRRPAWDPADPNKGIGSFEELQVPPSVNIYSDVIKTNLTPEVIPNIMQKLSKDEEKETFAPLSPPAKQDSFAPLSPPVSSDADSFAPLSPPSSSSYQPYDSVPNHPLVETLKVQLQNSPIRHAINKGQWVYQAEKQSFTKNSFHKGQLLEWIKNLEQDIEPTRKIPSKLEDTEGSSFMQIDS